MMMGWLMRMWRRRQRALDMKLLWPECKSQTSDIEHARAAFMLHAMHDTAWTRDFTEVEIIEMIGRMQ